MIRLLNFIFKLVICSILVFYYHFFIKIYFIQNHLKRKKISKNLIPKKLQMGRFFDSKSQMGINEDILNKNVKSKL